MNELNYTCISIHAPPRGATVELSAITGLPYISIHAPPRGATIHPRHVLDPEQFQFTPLREGRLPAPEVADAPEGISIHAPPRGATNCAAVRERQEAISIHAPPRGATHSPSPWYSAIVFQFTPLREGRQPQRVPLRWTSTISIHAPPRGATRSWAAKCGWNRFQFTPLREGRRYRAN